MESGAVGLVLRISRVMGIAPYPRGSRVRVSKALIVYGFVLVTFISFYLLSGTCIFIMKQKPPLLARDITRTVGNLVTVTLVLLGAYTAQGRMQHMARSLNQLEQINEKIGAIPKDHVTFWLIVGFIFGSFIVHVIDTCIFIFVISKNTWPVFFIIYFLEQNYVVLLGMQLVAFAARILLTLKMINKSLQHISRIESICNIPRMYTTSMNRYRKMPKVAWEMVNIEDSPVDVNNAINVNNGNKNNYIFTNKDVLGTNEAERTEYMIRQLAVHYRHICDIIRTWTSSDGLLMALILLSRMFDMLLLLHKLIMGLTQGLDIFLTVYLSINSIKHVTALVLFVEPFQRTHIQMERTSIIVQTLKCNCGEYQPLRNELDLFLRMLKLQKVSYSPLDMCTLGRPLVLKIFGILITYSMVMLTYGPEAQTPSLIFTYSF